MTDLPEPPFTEREDAFLSLAERYQENLRHEQLANAELRAERDRWRKIADDFAEAGTHPTAHEMVVEDYEKEARRD